MKDIDNNMAGNANVVGSGKKNMTIFAMFMDMDESYLFMNIYK